MFVTLGICDWDGSMKDGLKKGLELKRDWQNLSGEKEVPWNDFWTVIIDGVVDGLKECAKKREKAWTLIYDSSTNLKNKVETNQQLQQQVDQQAIGLAVGVPGGAAVGAGIYPLFKFCMKFFSK